MAQPMVSPATPAHPFLSRLIGVHPRWNSSFGGTKRNLDWQGQGCWQVKNLNADERRLRMISTDELVGLDPWGSRHTAESSNFKCGLLIVSEAAAKLVTPRPRQKVDSPNPPNPKHLDAPFPLIILTVA